MGELKTYDTLRQIKKGDREFLRKVYNENRDRFLNFAKNLGLNSEDARDVYQNTIIAFSESILDGKIKKLRSSVSTYLFGIGKHMIYSQLRKNSLYKDSPVLVLNETKEEIYVNFSDNNYTKEQRLLQKALKKIGVKCIEVLELFYFEGFDLDEIMDLTSYKSKQVLRSQKSRCISQLKEIIKRL